MAKHGKKYLAAAEKIEEHKAYSPEEAIQLLKDTKIAKFDSTVEVHVCLGVDPRHADQMVRDTIVLPHGLGKAVSVLVFAQGEGARVAKEAGADFIADDDEMIKKIQGGWTDFDVAISTPDMMAKAGRLGRVLGPRGLMPNPRTGTVVSIDDLPKAINEAKSGRVEFRVDKTANLHVPFGKNSFSNEKLTDNLVALMTAVKKARPAASKGAYIKKIILANTMGPGIKVDISSLLSMEFSE
jgi:large subunit ribosomal protein L1